MPNSRQETTTLQCPACGASFDAAVWIIVDADQRPDLVQAIMHGALNQHYCPECHASGTINAPLLFHDGAQQRMILALPLSVTNAADAQSIAEQLVGYLHESLQANGMTIQPYQTQVDVAADLDDLRSMLASDQHDAGLQTALEAILASDSPQAFEQSMAQHRRILMSDHVEPMLNELIAQAHADNDHALASHISDIQATLGQFRQTWQARGATLDRMIDQLAVDPAIEQTLHSMAHAVDPQDVYAARLKLNPAQQTMLDDALDRLVEFAQTHDESVVGFLHELTRMREQ